MATAATRTTTKSKGTEVVAISADQEKALATLGNDFEELAGVGFEEADRESYAIPFIKILQKMSPEVDEADPAYVEGAKPGMFFNTATNEFMDGKAGITLVPVHFQRHFIHWAPRDSGGGYLGDHTPGEVASMDTVDNKGKLMLDDGTYLADTREHYCLLVGQDDCEPCVVSMAATQIKKSKKWMHQMQQVKLKRADGTRYTPPMCARLWRATTVLESNDQGSWYGWQLTPAQWESDTDRFAMALQFRQAILSGEAKRETPAAEATMDPTVDAGDFDSDVGF